MSDIYILEPDEAPLAQLIKRMTATEVETRQRNAAEIFAREMDEKIYRWFEDELTPFVCVSKASEPDKRRICPNFIMCNNASCTYFKPTEVQAERVLCYAINHKGEDIDLIEVDQC